MSDNLNTFTLKDVELYFTNHNKPKPGYAKPGRKPQNLVYSSVFGLTAEHVAELAGYGFDTNKIKPLTVKVKDDNGKPTGETVTLAERSLRRNRTAKDADKLVTMDASLATNPIKVTLEDGSEVACGIGNGSVGDVTFIITEGEDDNNIHIGSIKLTQFVPYEGRQTVQLNTAEDVQATIDKLNQAARGM